MPAWRAREGRNTRSSLSRQSPHREEADPVPLPRAAQRRVEFGHQAPERASRALVVEGIDQCRLVTRQQLGEECRDHRWFRLVGRVAQPLVEVDLAIAALAGPDDGDQQVHERRQE